VRVRWGKPLLLAAVLTCAFAVFVPSASAQSLGGCQLDGNASFSPGLTGTAQAFSYSFNGTLSGCQSSESGAPTSGTVSAGEVVTIGGVQYTEPKAQGNGSCGSSTTSGQAITTWQDGTRTITDYTTSGAAAAVQLSGTVVDSITLQPVDPTQPPLTLTSTRYQGQSESGLLTFQPPDPTACETPAGVTAAKIQGLVGLSG
jgi:hypothetical protein